jgi:hypothetical protein
MKSPLRRSLLRVPLLLLAASLAPALMAQQEIAQQQMPQGTISATPHSAIEAAGDSYRYPVETLHYDAEWRLWRAGSATLRIQPGTNPEMEHVTATAESSGAVAVVFRVEDRIESYFNRHSDCSDRILKHTEEGFHKRETSLVFDPLHGKSILDERNLRNGELKHQVTDSPACVTDVLSGIYYLGTRPLQAGEVNIFPINDGGKTVDVTSLVEGREDVKTDAGTFHTVRVVIYSGTGPLKGRGKVWIWYTDDASHLPVQMRSRLFWGTMTLRLTREEK